MTQKRQILQYDKSGNLIRQFDSIKEAQSTYGITHISCVCRGKRRQDGGFVWRYKDGIPEPQKKPDFVKSEI